MKVWLSRHKVFLQMQAALFLVHMHPAFCDAFELANALASQERAKTGENSDDLDKLEHQSPTSSDNRSDTCALTENSQCIRERKSGSTHASQ